MITTGSKFFYGLAALLVVAAVVYGYASGGGGLGPLSAGYKGGVGEHLGYGILLGAAVASLFTGFCTTAFRDADPEPTAAAARHRCAPGRPRPRAPRSGPSSAPSAWCSPSSASC